MLRMLEAALEGLQHLLSRGTHRKGLVTSQAIVRKQQTCADCKNGSQRTASHGFLWNLPKLGAVQGAIVFLVSQL